MACAHESAISNSTEMQCLQTGLSLGYRCLCSHHMIIMWANQSDMETTCEQM